MTYENTWEHRRRSDRWQQTWPWCRWGDHRGHAKVCVQSGGILFPTSAANNVKVISFIFRLWTIQIHELTNYLLVTITNVYTYKKFVIEDDLHGPLLVAVDVGDELLEGNVELLNLACKVSSGHSENVCKTGLDTNLSFESQIVLEVRTQTLLLNVVNSVEALKGRQCFSAIFMVVPLFSLLIKKIYLLTWHLP